MRLTAGFWGDILLRKAFQPHAWPNNALQLTAYSLRSCVAPASGSS